MQLNLRVLCLVVTCFFIAQGVAAERADADVEVEAQAQAQTQTGVVAASNDSILGADFLDNQVPRQTLEVAMLAYDQKDSGGIEEIDENASIFEAVIIYSNKITKSDTLTLTVLTDVVSSASNTKDRLVTSAASAATNTANAPDPIVYIHGDVSWEQRMSDWIWTLNAAYGADYAYQSTGFGGGLKRVFNNENTIIGLNVQRFADELEMFRFNGADHTNQDRDTLSTELEWRQILNRYSLVHLVAHYTTQSGFLATPYNSVFVNGLEDFEKLPDNRQRWSTTIRYKHTLGTAASYEIGIRHYEDDWGISAKTVDLHVAHYLNNRRMLVVYNYRYYTQTAADHYQESFTAIQEYQTSDPDLGTFTGHMIGIQPTFKERIIFGNAGEWNIGVYHYTRDNGLDMNWITTGLKITF